MADKTKIGWTDASWPVVTGCTHISEGCDNCYAAKLTGGRLKHLPAYEGLAEKGWFNGTVRLLPDRLDWPLHWRKPRMIFVSDMADLLHKDVPTEYIARVFAVMACCPQHTFQVLTKRHARLRSLLNDPRFAEAVNIAYCTMPSDIPSIRGYQWPLPNVHAGVSAENRKWYDIRWSALADTPAAVRFVSAEPLLGPIDLGLDHTGHESDAVNSWPHIRTCMDCSAGEGEAAVDAYHRPGQPKPDWVIAGGESGPGHRPMEMAWLESIANQCRMASIPLYVKQDSGPRAGQQGRIPDDIWALKQFPGDVLAVAS